MPDRYILIKPALSCQKDWHLRRESDVMIIVLRTSLVSGPVQDLGFKLLNYSSFFKKKIKIILF